jgi:hypothetical protein
VKLPNLEAQEFVCLTFASKGSEEAWGLANKASHQDQFVAPRWRTSHESKARCRTDTVKNRHLSAIHHLENVPMHSTVSWMELKALTYVCVCNLQMLCKREISTRQIVRAIVYDKCPRCKTMLSLKTFPSNDIYRNITQTSKIDAASGCRCIIQYLFLTTKTITSNRKLTPIRQNYIFIYGLNKAKKIIIQADINLTKYINKLFAQHIT